MKLALHRPTRTDAGSGTSARLPQLITVLAAAGLAAQLATLVWKFVPGARRPPPPPPSQPLQGPADLQGLLAARLFGNATPDAVSGVDAPRTNVALVLAGTLAVRDPKAGLAIIGEPTQPGHVYAVGATLPGGVRLHEVYVDRVVLDRGGALETLPLPHAVGGAAPRLASRPGEPGLGEAVQKLIAGGPEVIGDVLRPMPSYANGQLKGFRVYAGRDRRKFAKLGLQPGDVVTQVNGVPLGDSQKGLDALRTLGGGSATVTVERGGASQQLTIDASQVSGLAESEVPPPPAAVGTRPVPPPTTESSSPD